MKNIKKEIFEKTESICPVCKKVIEADIIEEESSIWMEKSCSIHGFFKAKLAKYAWYYKGLCKLYKLIHHQRCPYSRKNIKLYLLYPTWNCNLNCPICFSNSGVDNIHKDPSLEEIRDMVNAIKEPSRHICMLGGEPTIRDDLCEIVRIILKAGHIPLLYTNGIKLANIDYLKKLKMCGLRNINIWLETLKDDNVYQKIRGAKLVAIKRKALDNLKTLNMTTGLCFVLVRGINEGEISDVFNFAQKNNFITRLAVQSYANLGQKCFSREKEFTLDEIIEIICRETKSFITLEEFFLFQKLLYITEFLFLNNYVCDVRQEILIPRNNNKKIRDIFNLQKLIHCLDTFEEIYRESPFKAKTYFFKKIFIRLIQNPKFLSAIVKHIIYPNLPDNNYMNLSVIKLHTAYTYDIKRGLTRCSHAWLPSYTSREFVNLCMTIGNFCIPKSWP